MNKQTLIDKRAGLVAQMRELVDRAGEEKRDLSPEELSNSDKLYGEAEALKKQLDVVMRQEALDREMAEKSIRAGSVEAAVPAADRVMAGFRGYLTAGRGYGGEGASEFFALQADLDTQGGFLVPEQFANDLIQAMDNEVFVRKLATKLTLAKAASLGVPTLDADISDADWTSELGPVTEDTAMAFGKRTLTPVPLAKRIKISRKLLQVSAIPAETLMSQRLAYKFGVTEEKAFLTGNGANQPLGVFTASSQGISTSRDVATGNSSTAIGADGLYEAKFALKGGYWKNAQWLFHRDAVKQIAKLKDNNGQYLWQPAISAGHPDTVLQMPYSMSEYAPNTFTSGLYAGILGDFSKYWIADSLAMEVQRLDELYAEVNQIGFIGRMEVDGMPVLEEAFVRVKLA